MRPLTARANSSVPRIGYLSPDSSDGDEGLFAAFKAGLVAFEYIPHKTIEIERRSAASGTDQQEDRLTTLAEELVDLKVDVLVTGGPGVFAADRVTKTVPIVAAVAADLVAVGLADSLGHPGGNVTGGLFLPGAHGQAHRIPEAGKALDDEGGCTLAAELFGRASLSARHRTSCKSALAKARLSKSRSPATATARCRWVPAHRSTALRLWTLRNSTSGLGLRSSQWPQSATACLAPGRPPSPETEGFSAPASTTADVPPLRLLRRQDSQRDKARRYSTGRGDEVCDDRHFEDRKRAWPRHPAEPARLGGAGDRMRRREFVAALGVALAWPLAAVPKQRIARVGYLGPDPVDADPGHYQAFRSGLRELGYLEGESIEIVVRHPDQGGAGLSELAHELVDLGMDVIVTGGPGVFAAHEATKTVPIVAGVGGDLVGLGLAESLAHPGGNVTGMTYFAPQLVVKRVELLKLVKPSMTSTGLLFMRNSPSIPRYLQALDAPLKTLGLALQLIEVSDASECKSALDAGPAALIGGLAVTDFPPFNAGTGPAIVAGVAAGRGLPAAGGLTLPRNGGLLGYGVDFPSMFHRAATFVDRILKGANPGDLPIEQATKFETIANLKTASTLGIEIPSTLLAAADEVIE
ncbi:MAG: hypothetical protein JO273_06750 [Methylobacteriaceae bacterium]|nr:hypothetical protein [Methylobacteriaceae bacterium]